MLLASSILNHGGESEVNITDLPGGVQDGWKVMGETSLTPLTSSGRGALGTSSTGSNLLPSVGADPTKEEISVTLGQGQFGKAVQIATLAGCLKRVAELSTNVEDRKAVEGRTLKRCLTTCKTVIPPTTNQGYGGVVGVWLQLFDERLREIKTYHARHHQSQDLPILNNNNNNSNKRSRLGNAAADGYDVASLVSECVRPVVDGTLYQPEEVMGKYLDLQPIYEQSVVPIKHVFIEGDPKGGKTFGFVDFLGVISRGLSHLSETKKLAERKKYVRFLAALETYLEGFLRRTQPLLNLAEITGRAVSSFEDEWRREGGYDGWECKPAEASMVDSAQTDSNQDTMNETRRLDLSSFATAEDLEKAINGDELKAELSRLGMKCGGRPIDRAMRLFMTKDTPLDQLPKKLFVNHQASQSVVDGGAVTVGKNERRVDIARVEVKVVALLNQLKPTVEATSRRTERRETQTVREREKELEEDLHGATVEGPKVKDDDNDDDDSDDEDAPIYNPKGVPLGWDGKPIPYWLFKLHGLNHFYTCEICGNESYRGRRNFELHFAEAKHAFGMKSLGIPNTKHFHGVTKIEDALQLWEKLKGHLQQDQFDGTKDEEYEDSHGNVLSRATYEDLARQGLL